MSAATRTLDARARPDGAGRRGTARDGEDGPEMSINRTRGALYLLARLLGDVQAVRKGRVGQRIGRRVVGRIAGRGMGRLFR